MADHVPWPKHADGRNLRMGEMTPEMQRIQWQQAAQRVKAKFEQPAMQAAITKVLSGETDGAA